jgi:VanZ family protein
LIALWAPVVLYMGAIFYGASLSSVPAPVDSRFSDTFLHTAGYFGLALITLRALARGRWPGVTPGATVTAWCISVIHGAAVEWMQMYVPPRTAEWRDLQNDAIGAALALVLAGAWGIMRSTPRAD